MKRKIVRHLSVLACVSLLSGMSFACSEKSSGSGSELLSALVNGLTPQKAENGGGLVSASSYFHTEIFPPHWLNWTTDGANPIETGTAFLTRGLKCSGRYCDDVNLLASESGYTQTNSWWTDWFSEEGTNYRICDNNGFVTGIKCSGSYCDNVSLKCSQLNNNNVRTGCYWTGPISEEDGGKFVAPESMYIAGASCNGRYCDSMALYLCQADNGGPNIDHDALAQQFAPRLRFDQETTTGSGDSGKCFPSDAGSYFTQRAAGASPQSLCNKDYSSISNNQVPIYYDTAQVGTNAVLIRYWFFYAWQSTCFLSFGSHAADWEGISVLVVNGQMKRVAFSQHSGWYSKEIGNFQVVDGTHPVGYVGKNAHGTFHDDGGSGGCLYFEDYRNPGGNDYHMDSWNNLVRLKRGSDAPDWMNCQGDSCFDGIGHPMERGDWRSRAGCGSDGCGKSSVGGNIPFVNDPTGSDFSTIWAKHSGRVLDVGGASTSDSVNIWQWANLNADNQKWSLESTGDGYFKISAKHSGKCMDVKGASNAGGTNVVQYSCGSGSNQRFQLLSYGDGYFALQAKHSSQCLDIAGAAAGDGGLLIQWPCAWTDNEKFKFTP
ncbi:RICIN domain-containing protein [Leptospira wolffii]|uniref:RICIN domain-containing protein n=1 Tax=Leptospira wolffii TaxID=409998 RepID=UPI001FEF0A87|nr:RICIN domain-containing protein [Leptospira wolffii]